MFPNLRAEMARKNFTAQILSEKTLIPYSTLTPKLRGEKPITLGEAKKIKKALETEISIDELFDTEV